MPLLPPEAQGWDYLFTSTWFLARSPGQQDQGLLLKSPTLRLNADSLLLLVSNCGVK